MLLKNGPCIILPSMCMFLNGLFLSCFWTKILVYMSCTSHVRNTSDGVTVAVEHSRSRVIVKNSKFKKQGNVMPSLMNISVPDP
jgi:hypothetical protein